MRNFEDNSRVKHDIYGTGKVTHSGGDGYSYVEFDTGVEKNILEEKLTLIEDSMVKIKSIHIKNLFNQFNYDIEVDIENDVAILIAPNGCGKTTIFKILDFMFNPSLNAFHEIKSIPFDTFSFQLSNGYMISFCRESLEEAIVRLQKNLDTEDSKLTLRRYCKSYPHDFVLSVTDSNGDEVEKISFYKAILEYYNTPDILSHFDSCVDANFYDFVDDKRLDSTDKLRIESFIKQLQSSQWKKAMSNTDLKFIDANRLQKKYSSPESVDKEKDTEKVDFFIQANETIREDVRRCLGEYNREVENAKSELVKEYIQTVNISTPSFEAFQSRWDSYQEELRKFQELGLLKSKELTIDSQTLKDAFQYKAEFLTTYLNMFEKTLEPLRAICEKLKLFADIFHKRNEITRKCIRFTENGIEISSKGKKIDIDCLSSGEKHDFAMFFNLIFDTPKNSIILIDEPEISWHIEWQSEFLDQLIDICRINGTQAIVATHSPYIIYGHDDLVVDKQVTENE